MKKLCLIPFLLLVACGHDQETGLAKWPTIPDLPSHLDKKTERLPDITDPSMGGLEIQGAEDDSKYNDVAHRYNTLLDIFNCVKVSMNEKRPPEECFK